MTTPTGAPAPPTDTSPGWEFGGRVRYWVPKPGGEVLITKGGRTGSGTTIDVEEDLDLETGSAPSVRLDVTNGPHRLYAWYEPVTWHGEATLDRKVVFRRVTFAAGEEVESDLTMNFVTVGYDYAVVDQPEGLVRLGLGANMWTFEGSLEASPSGVDASRTFTHVLPILSIEGERRFGVWTIAADVAYGTVGSDRWLFDIEACVGIQITDNLTFDLGYRYWKKSFDETTNHAELEASGPFLALMLRF